jgi:hypothetical protein
MEEPMSKFYTVKGEIEDLESLLPDLRKKIAVNTNLENEAIHTGRMEDVAMYSEDSPNSENPATDKNATRKKRNPDNNAGTEPVFKLPKKL